MKLCASCGNIILAGWAYCSYCGVKADGFARVEDRFTSLDARIDALKGRIAIMEQSTGDSLAQPSSYPSVPTMAGNGTSMPPAASADSPAIHWTHGASSNKPVPVPDMGGRYSTALETAVRLEMVVERLAAAERDLAAHSHPEGIERGEPANYNCPNCGQVHAPWWNYCKKEQAPKPIDTSVEEELWKRLEALQNTVAVRIRMQSETDTAIKRDIKELFGARDDLNNRTNQHNGCVNRDILDLQRRLVDLENAVQGRPAEVIDRYADEPSIDELRQKVKALEENTHRVFDTSAEEELWKRIKERLDRFTQDEIPKYIHNTFQNFFDFSFCLEERVEIMRKDIAAHQQALVELARVVDVMMPAVEALQKEAIQSFKGEEAVQTDGAGVPMEPADPPRESTGGDGVPINQFLCPFRKKEKCSLLGAESCRRVECPLPVGGEAKP